MKQSRDISKWIAFDKCICWSQVQRFVSPVFSCLHRGQPCMIDAAKRRIHDQISGWQKQGITRYIEFEPHAHTAWSDIGADCLKTPLQLAHLWIALHHIADCTSLFIALQTELHTQGRRRTHCAEDWVSCTCRKEAGPYHALSTRAWSLHLEGRMMGRSSKGPIWLSVCIPCARPPRALHIQLLLSLLKHLLQLPCLPASQTPRLGTWHDCCLVGVQVTGTVGCAVPCTIVFMLFELELGSRSMLDDNYASHHSICGNTDAPG